MYVLMKSAECSSFSLPPYDIQTNKDRCAELMDKVSSYACVVFEALRSSKIRSGKEFDDLDTELQHIARSISSLSLALR
jgi:hypothetical protein